MENISSLACWIAVVVQVTGFIAVLIARHSEQALVTRWCQVLFLSCLTLVGLTTIGAVCYGSICWVSCGFTFCLMTVAATLDVGKRKIPSGF